MKTRKIPVLILTAILCSISTFSPVLAAPATASHRKTVKPEVWSVDPANTYFEDEIEKAVTTCVPKQIIEEFNGQGYSVVISTKSCDRYNIAGLTNGTPTDKNGWYAWAPEHERFMELTPTYGIHSAQMTALHEFGHVLDMMTAATADASMLAAMTAEIPAYNQVMVNSGYMVPEIKDGHELFAQVFASVVSGNTGYANCATEITAACPVTAAYVQKTISSLR